MMQHFYFKKIKDFLGIFFISLSILLSGCKTYQSSLPSSNQLNQTTWVLIGHNNQAIARVNTLSNQCPSITIDGLNQPMLVRAQAGVIPLRPTASRPQDSKPAAFSSMTCEITLPPNITSASIGNQVLPIPKTEPKRIVVLGDTGCRMKKSSGVFQNCLDNTAWPFATIARVAASFKPDLVLHVGDYHYRENQCPTGDIGCLDSPWGYGSDTWEADLFQPAAPLFAIAPWIVIRGNHEECARAGQGWFRYLDTQPYTPTRTCNNPMYDDIANYSAPYAITLDKKSQIIVFDSAKSAHKTLSEESWQYIQYQQQLQLLTELVTQPNIESFFVSHHPILGWSHDLMLKKIMQNFYGNNAYFPKEIRAAFHGHVHNMQIIDFSSNHPATFVIGNSGDHADPDVSEIFPIDSQPTEGAMINHFTHSNQYGFLLMEKLETDWIYKAYNANGDLLTICKMVDYRKLNCNKTGRL